MSKNVLNPIDIQFITERQQQILKALHQFLENNQITEIYVYDNDHSNTFLGVALTPFNYQQIYQSDKIKTTIITPTFNYPLYDDYHNDPEYNNHQNIILFTQKSNCSDNDISYKIYTEKDNHNIFNIILETKSEKGHYDIYSMDMYFNSLN